MATGFGESDEKDLGDAFVDVGVVGGDIVALVVSAKLAELGVFGDFGSDLGDCFGSLMVEVRGEDLGDFDPADPDLEGDS